MPVDIDNSQLAPNEDCPDPSSTGSPVEESRDKKPPKACYRSRHSSRSSSFNDSMAEIVLGLFQSDTRSQPRFGHSTDASEEDPVVREMFIRAEARNSESWLSKRLAQRELWDSSESDIEDDSESESVSGSRKRKRELSVSLKEEGTVDVTRTKRPNTRRDLEGDAHTQMDSGTEI